MVSANFILPQSSFIWWFFIIESDNSASYMYNDYIFFFTLKYKIACDTQMIIIISDTLRRSIKRFSDTTLYHKNRLTGMVRRFDSPTLFCLILRKHWTQIGLWCLNSLYSMYLKVSSSYWKKKKEIWLHIKFNVSSKTVWLSSCRTIEMSDLRSDP